MKNNGYSKNQFHLNLVDQIDDYRPPSNKQHAYNHKDFDTLKDYYSIGDHRKTLKQNLMFLKKLREDVHTNVEYINNKEIRRKQSLDWSERILPFENDDIIINAKDPKQMIEMRILHQKQIQKEKEREQQLLHEQHQQHLYQNVPSYMQPTQTSQNVDKLKNSESKITNQRQNNHQKEEKQSSKFDFASGDENPRRKSCICKKCGPLTKKELQYSHIRVKFQNKPKYYYTQLMIRDLFFKQALKQRYRIKRQEPRTKQAQKPIKQNYYPQSQAQNQQNQKQALLQKQSLSVSQSNQVNQTQMLKNADGVEENLMQFLERYVKNPNLLKKTRPSKSNNMYQSKQNNQQNFNQSNGFSNLNTQNSQSSQGQNGNQNQKNTYTSNTMGKSITNNNIDQDEQQDQQMNLKKSLAKESSDSPNKQSNSNKNKKQELISEHQLTRSDDSIQEEESYIEWLQNSNNQDIKQLNSIKKRDIQFSIYNISKQNKLGNLIQEQFPLEKIQQKELQNQQKLQEQSQKRVNTTQSNQSYQSKNQQQSIWQDRKLQTKKLQKDTKKDNKILPDIPKDKYIQNCKRDTLQNSQKPKRIKPKNQLFNSDIKISQLYCGRDSYLQFPSTSTTSNQKKIVSANNLFDQMPSRIQTANPNNKRSVKYFGTLQTEQSESRVIHTSQSQKRNKYHLRKNTAQENSDIQNNNQFLKQIKVQNQQKTKSTQLTRHPSKSRITKQSQSNIKLQNTSEYYLTGGNTLPEQTPSSVNNSRRKLTSGAGKKRVQIKDNQNRSSNLYQTQDN